MSRMFYGILPAPLFACIAALLCASIAAPAKAQVDPARAKAVQEAMSKLAFMEGVWKGTGTISMGPGRKASSQVVENATFKLQKSLFMFEGQGKIPLPNGQERIVHDAIGIISWDVDKKRYAMRTYRAGGETLDPHIEVSGNKVVWGFEQPNAGKIRFTLTVADGRWKEIGQISRDQGKTWFDFFEMDLKKQN